MKTVYRFILIAGCIFLSARLPAQYWTQKANVPGAVRTYAAGFSIGHYGFIGCGASSPGGPSYYQDFYKWNQTTNTWSAIANYPGAGYELSPVSFSIEGYGYVGCGWTGHGGAKDLWRYDTSTNVWTQMASLPGTGRYDESVFVIGHKAYVIGGSTGGPPYLQDVWMYDAHTNTWTQKNNSPAGKNDAGAAFAIGNHGYYGGGKDGSIGYNAFWEYDTTSDTWTSIAAFPTAQAPTGDARAFVLGSKGYVCTGGIGDVSYTVDIPVGYAYDTNTHAWTAFTNMGANRLERGFSVAFSITGTCESFGYIGTGEDSLNNMLNTFWQWGDTLGGSGSYTITGTSPICAGSSDIISATGGTSYLWSTGATTSSINVTPSSTTIYTVQITGGGCQKDTSITIAVVPYPTISLSGIDTVCSGSSTTLSATGGSSYLWSTGATTSSISPTPSSNTIYTVEVSNGACSKDTTIAIIVNPSPSLVIGSSTDTICLGSSVALNVSGANSYTWTPSTGLSCNTCSNPTATPTITTTYFVTGQNIDGCTDTKSIQVIVNTQPVFATIPNQTICSGGYVTLTANLTSGFNGTYLWQPGGLTGPSISVSPDSTVTYTVEYTNSCGTASTSVTVFISPIPTPSFSADITQGCAPLCIQFRNLSRLSSGNITMWRWTFGNGDTLNEENPLYCYPHTGTFSPSLTIVSSNGCSATLKIDQMITVYSKPVANFIYSPNPVCIIEPTVQFADESTDAYGIVYWKWSFGDGETPYAESLLKNPGHTYPDTGTYCPQLIVENNKGCIDTATNCLQVEPLFTLYIPSAFSPNGDGLNDVFEPKGTYVKNFEMYIFDRWGMELYHTTDLTKGWNGTVNGGSNTAQEDSYVYKIIATDWSNTQHSYLGTVLLIK